MQAVVLIALIISIVVISKSSTAKKKEISNNPISKVSNTPVLALTLTPSPSPSPSKIYNLTTPTVQSYSDLQYPNSRQTGSNDASLIFESTDDPDLITNWYKEKIRDLGMNSKSFVQTKTNGNVLNKLVGARGDKEVRVEIVKKNDESVTKITVSTTIPIDNQKTF